MAFVLLVIRDSICAASMFGFNSPLSAKIILAPRNTNALAVAEELNLLQISNSNELEEWINEVINKMPDKIQEYKKGKKGLIGLFVGEVKKLSKGKADPAAVTNLLQKKLE